MVVFGGSEGGLSGPVIEAASLLAARGYPAIALTYFREPGLPATLTNVPLEYFTRAVRLLRSQPGVDPDHVLVQGASRGSEGALRRSGRRVAVLRLRRRDQLASEAAQLQLSGHGAEVPGHNVGIFTTSYTTWAPVALEPAPDGLTPGGTLPATLAGAADSHAKLLDLLRSL